MYKPHQTTSPRRLAEQVAPAEELKTHHKCTEKKIKLLFL